MVIDHVRVLLTLVLLFGVSCATSRSDVVEPVVVAKTATRARSADLSYISWREHLIDDEGVNGGVPTVLTFTNHLSWSPPLKIQLNISQSFFGLYSDLTFHRHCAIGYFP